MTNFQPYQKVVLVVLDGFGVATYSHGNAVALANPSAIAELLSHYPSLTILASGPVVGLPYGEMGNSEVGHINMGAGRTVGQDLPRINTAISDRSFFLNPVFEEACAHVNKNQSQLHLIGMASSGGVHSSEDHLYALIGMAAEQGVKHVFIHMITDGRDTGQKVALESLSKLQLQINNIGLGKIATITGRFYAMDRARHYEQTMQTYNAIVFGKGVIAESAEEAVLNNYNQNIFDEMIPPTVIMEPGEDKVLHPVGTVKENDAVVFFNFRSDRALQLTQAFVTPQVMTDVELPDPINNLFFVTMTQYLANLPVKVAFPPIDLENNLALFLSKQNYKQFHIAESEKYAHVTSFFNGGNDEALPGEDRTIIKSPADNADYAQRPQMSGQELTEEFVDKILHNDYRFYLANFANGDMVGHTGNMEASIKAVQYLDRFLEKISKAVLDVGGVLIITADHGNIEVMIDPKTGDINKEHTTSPIPFMVISKEFAYKQSKEKNYLSLSSQVPSGIIPDVAPTILELFGLEKPPQMNGVSLLPQILSQLE